MDLTNILLWTFSLTLAVVGILFGIIASINSSKANRKVQDLISNTFVAEESQKFLFDNIKNVVTANRKTIRALKYGITYADYSLVSSHTRLHLLSKSTIQMLSDTEFRDVTRMYLDIKDTLDRRFASIVNISNLSTKKKISESIQQELREYHQQVIVSATDIIKAYTATIDYTTEHKIKK